MAGRHKCGFGSYPPAKSGYLFRREPSPTMSTDARFGGLYSISTSQGALADSAPIRQHRRSIATIKALQESASEGSLYPSVAVKPELAQDWQANVCQQDGFHSASVLREPIGMLTPYVENELTRSIKNMGRQHGMNGRRASEAPPSADGDAPTKVLMRTQLLPSAVVRDLWRTSKKPLSNEIVKARAAAEAKARGEAKAAAMPTESERCAEGARAVMEAKTRMGMCYDEYLSENPLLSRSVTTDDFFSRGMEWTGAPRHHLPCIPLHPLPSRTPTCLSTQVSPPPHLTGTSAHARTRREHQLQRAEMRVRTQQGSLLRLGDYAEADFDREFARQTVEYLLWQCPNSAPVPRGAPGGSGRLNTSMVAVLKPPGAWPTASDPRAAAATVADFAWLLPIQTRRSGTTQAERDSRKEWEARERRKEYCETICLPERAPAFDGSGHPPGYRDSRPGAHPSRGHGRAAPRHSSAAADAVGASPSGLSRWPQSRRSNLARRGYGGWTSLP